MKLTGERPMQGATPDSLLALHACTSRARLFTSDFVSASSPLSFCPRNSASTIAARIPIRMTVTSYSTSVKPSSREAARAVRCRIMAIT